MKNGQRLLGERKLLAEIRELGIIKTRFILHRVVNDNEMGIKEALATAYIQGVVHGYEGQKEKARNEEYAQLKTDETKVEG